MNHGRADLPEEAMVRVDYNGRTAARLLCSPRELREAAAGWLFTEGYLRAPDEIIALGACEQLRAVSVTAAPDRWDEVSNSSRAQASGCGS